MMIYVQLCISQSLTSVTSCEAYRLNTGHLISFSSEDRKEKQSEEEVEVEAISVFFISKLCDTSEATVENEVNIFDFSNFFFLSIFRDKFWHAIKSTP